MFTIGATIAILVVITGAVRDRPFYEHTWVDHSLNYIFAFGCFLMVLSLLIWFWHVLP
jgi:hypothetical protein